MVKGTIKRLMSDRGFGYIKSEKENDDVWFHASMVKGEVPFENLSVGTVVEFEAQESERGLRARFVRAIAVQGTETGLTAKISEPNPVRRQYRFLNPYNFVRFLPPPDKKETEGPKTDFGAALLAAVRIRPTSAPVKPEAELLGRCAPPPHDRFVGVTGKIACLLETVTPLFVSDSENIEHRGEHNSFDFFKLNNKHALPASSLRGMVRNLFEAATNSCLNQIMDKRLSFHLPPAQALQLVPARVEKNGDGNWSLRLLTGTTSLNIGGRPNGPQYAAWVLSYPKENSNKNGDLLYNSRKEVLFDKREHKTKCWAYLKLMKHPRRNFSFWNVEEMAFKKEDLQKDLLSLGTSELVAEGYLCVTNENIPNKHDERFFFHKDGLNNAPAISISESVRNDYSVLISDYQSRHKERVEKRRKDGKDPESCDGDEPAFSRFIVHSNEAELHDSDLVYAMLNSFKQVEFIVPVSVPRVAYNNSILDLLPDNALPEESKYASPCSKYGDLCPACRVFGWVYQAKKGEKIDLKKQNGYAGRVRFSHGAMTRNNGTLPPIPSAILSSPKPTTTGFYLVNQDGSIPVKLESESARKGYDGNNVLRGRKFYRHHGTANQQEYYRAGGRCDDQNRTVRDALQPGACFEFEISFENLAFVELGALIWALEMDGKGYHRLGFAKPLGFGSVKIKVNEIRLLDPAKRYSSLNDDGWHSVEDWKKYVEKFKEAMLDRYSHRSADFDSMDNIKDLRSILSEPPDSLPIHYPRSTHQPDPEGKNFEWFMGNNRRQSYALPAADKDEGLPLIKRDGHEVK